MAKPDPAPRLTDEVRHERFVAMAREVEAEDSAEPFDDAFERVAGVAPKDKPDHG